VDIRELHGDGDDGNTTLIGLNIMRNTAAIAGMGTTLNGSTLGAVTELAVKPR